MFKKVSVVVASLCIAASLCAAEPDDSSSISIPTGSMTVQPGGPVSLPVNGYFIHAGNDHFVFNGLDFSVPEEFSKDTLLVVFNYSYYYQGKENDAIYELIMSGVSLSPAVSSAQMGTEIPSDTVIGTALTDKVTVSIRSIYLDPNLVVISQNIPCHQGRYWYYGVELFMPQIMHWFSYMPVKSGDDKIQFGGSGSDQSLREVAEGSQKKDSTDNYRTFPTPRISFKIKLSEYPEEKKPENSWDSFFKTCTHELRISYDSVPLLLFFKQGFDQYLKDEYKLGDDLYLYVDVMYAVNGELDCYVRDFATEDPENSVMQKLVTIGQAAGVDFAEYLPDNQTDANSPSEKDSTYTDVPLPEFPVGAVKEYVRFFYQDKNGVFVENTDNIEENWYYQDGRRFLHAFWDTKEGVHRARFITEYDDKNRETKTTWYDANQYKKNGTWIVDDHAWRPAQRTDVAYAEKDGRTIRTEQEYRYSYQPEQCTPDSTKVIETDGNGTVRSERSKNSDGSTFDTTEYDEHGNITRHYFDDGDKKGNRFYKNTYDQDGNLIAVVISEKDGAAVTVTNTCNPEGTVALSKNSDGTTARYLYDSKKRPVEYVSINDATGEEQLHYYKRYDSATGRVIFELDEDFVDHQQHCRFWLTEREGDAARWQKTVDPYQLLETLPVK